MNQKQALEALDKIVKELSSNKNPTVSEQELNGVLLAIMGSYKEGDTTKLLNSMIRGFLFIATNGVNPTGDEWLLQMVDDILEYSKTRSIISKNYSALQAVLSVFLGAHGMGVGSMSRLMMLVKDFAVCEKRKILEGEKWNSN